MVKTSVFPVSRTARHSHMMILFRMPGFESHRRASTYRAAGHSRILHSRVSMVWSTRNQSRTKECYERSCLGSSSYFFAMLYYVCLFILTEFCSDVLLTFYLVLAQRRLSRPSRRLLLHNICGLESTLPDSSTMLSRNIWTSRSARVAFVRSFENSTTYYTA